MLQSPARSVSVVLVTVTQNVYYPVRLSPGETVVVLRPLLGRLGQMKGYAVMLPGGSPGPVKSQCLEIHDE
jgi:hypothetical protein